MAGTGAVQILIVVLIIGCTVVHGASLRESKNSEAVFTSEYDDAIHDVVRRDINLGKTLGDIKKIVNDTVKKSQEIVKELVDAAGNLVNGTTGVRTPPPECAMPKQVGPCTGYFPRYYYSQEDNQCTKFIYGGCDANDNNFETEQECEAACE